ncbi:MAG TPA: tetratricopeptide repeat protein [Gemmataceae bacterium]|nr:tetratricopeptide repeat protein [Gemmataceae bacterium]
MRTLGPAAPTNGAALSFALDRTGQRLAEAQDGVQIRKLDSGEVLASWKLPAVWHLAWSDDGHWLAAAGSDGRIYILDTVSPRQHSVLEGHELSAVKVAFNHAGTLLASSGWDNQTRLWDTHSGKELVMAQGSFLQFSPDDRSLAYTRGREVGIWKVSEGRVCRKLYGHQPTSGAALVQFSADGQLLASSANDGVSLWDTHTLRQVAYLPELGRTIGVLFPSKGDSLITSGTRGLYHWPLRPAPEGKDHRLLLGPPLRIHVPVQQLLERAQCDREGNKLAVVDIWQQVVVLDLRRPSQQIFLRGHANVGHLAMSPDGRWLTTGTFKGKDIKIWDLASSNPQQAVWTLSTADDASALFSPDGEWLVVNQSDACRFYRAGSWQPAQEIRNEKMAGLPTVSAFTQDGRMMAVHFDGRYLDLLDPATSQEIVALTTVHTPLLGASTFSPDGSLLAVGTNEGILYLWDLRRLRQELANMGLDWPQPPYPPVDSGAAAQSLRVEVDLGKELGRVPGGDHIEIAVNSLLLVLNPFNFEAYFQRGRAYGRLGEYPHAIADYSMALALMPAGHPGRGEALFRRSNNYRHLYDPSRAEADLQTLAAGDLELPFELKSAAARQCNGLAWQCVTGPEEERDLTRALPLAEKAVAWAPELGRKTLGVVYYRLGRYPEAIVQLERDLHDTQGQAAAYDLFFLAMCHARQGDAAKAQDCHDRALDWMRQKQGDLPPGGETELANFRAEAESLLRSR